jgi:hypothetical protein
MNQQCVAFLMSDHERLHKLLHSKNTVLQPKPAISQIGRQRGKRQSEDKVVYKTSK